MNPDGDGRIRSGDHDDDIHVGISVVVETLAGYTVTVFVELVVVVWSVGTQQESVSQRFQIWSVRIAEHSTVFLREDGWSVARLGGARGGGWH